MALDQEPPTGSLYPYFLLASGLAEYRLENFIVAEKRLRGVLAIKGGGWNRVIPADLVLAMTLQKQGRGGEALAYLTVARTIFDRDIPKTREDEWHDVLICKALRREAESLIYDAGFPSAPFAGPQPR
jgi:hypothetical protein